MMHAAPPQLWLGLGVFGVIWLVLVPIGLAPTFGALGVERSRAWVPFVNLATVYRLGGFSEFWLVALVIPGPSIFGLIVLFVASHHIGRALGRGPWWTVLAVVQWWLWALILGLTHPRRCSSIPGGEPEIWSVQPRPQTAIAIPPDRDDIDDRGATDASASVSASISAPLPVVEPVPAPTVEPMPPVEAAPLEETPPEETLPEETRLRESVPPAPTPAPAPRAESPVTEAPQTSAVAAPREQTPPTAQTSPEARTPSTARIAPPPSAAPAAPAAPPLAGPVPTLVSDPDDDATIITNDQTVITGIRRGDDAEATIVSPRRRKWWLTTTLGTRVELTAPAALLGRRPSPHPLYPGAQLIVVTDDARSVSATHAVLEFVNDQWQITDLDSTNGVWLVDPDTGVESELGAGKRARVTPDFLLGELGVKVVQGG